MTIMTGEKLQLTIVWCFLFLVNFSSAQIIKEKTRIPLNNSIGVPYFISQFNVFGICGFEVDPGGNYYFMAGDYKKGTTTLAVFKGTKQKYRKTYDSYFANQMLINGKKIYLIDNSLTKNIE